MGPSGGAASTKIRYRLSLEPFGLKIHAEAIMVAFPGLRIGLVSIALGVCLFPHIGFAQQTSTFCIEGGLQIGVERFEIRNNKYFLYVPGAAAPLEYAESSIKGINVPCQNVQKPPAKESPKEAQETTQPGGPRQFGVQGSNTIGERLMPLLIEAFGQKKFGVKPTSKLTANEEQEITLKDASGTRAVVALQSHGSGTATPGLAEGKAVIGMASRRLNGDEQKRLNEAFKLDILAPGNEHVLALDGLAVIVNSDNRVKELSLDQIARIFAGEITNWSDVGGDDQPITLYRRDNKSGTFDTFKNLVLAPAGGTKREISPQAKAFESSESLSEEVAHDPKAIGFIALPYIGKNSALAISSSCGIASTATKFAIKSEEYPLARRLYLYTIGTPSDPLAHDLLDFVLSDDAQTTVQDAEFVDQAIDFEDDDVQSRWAHDIASDPSRTLPADKPVPRGSLQTFAWAMDKVHRTTIAFRFEKGSAQLDNRALQDVARLARFLSAPGRSGKHYIIAGFADATGGWASNSRLAAGRANAVVAELAKSGIRVPRDSIIPFSYMAPVACNDTDVGAAKNRRVEVWIER
jgi:phosphate transport system substrate-binding protein